MCNHLLEEGPTGSWWERHVVWFDLMRIHYTRVAEPIRPDAPSMQREEEVNLRRCQLVFGQPVRLYDCDEADGVGLAGK